MNVCYSGGARGSDKLWGSIASELGHGVCHYSFSGHGVSVPKRFVQVLSQEELEEADRWLHVANRSLGRTVPSACGNLYVLNLLRRNYWQICNTDSVYAICELDKNGIPYGGTAWAIAMALHFGVPVYVYQPVLKEWLVHSFGGWIPVKGSSIPRPRGQWTGIGTRRLDEETEQYIREWVNDPLKN